MYMRTWELDSEQPRINVASLYARLRHYRNLQRMPELLEELLSTYRFVGVAEHLGLELTPNGHPDAARRSGRTPERTDAASSLVPASASTVSLKPLRVSVVVPCFNESQSLRYLGNTLKRLSEKHRRDFAFTYVLVDDRSTDSTWAQLQALFGSRDDCRLIRHEQNRGVAAAIQTGVRQAPDEVVCSIDCDCTYDPEDLCRMIPLLADGVDVVTASPYHPAGGVKNVPAWRLFLSRGLSRLYRLVFRQKLHTYTSCCRVYRKSSVEAVEIRLPGFLGISELLARVDLAGGRIVEFPTTLEVRVLGISKMRVARTIVGHLGFFLRLVRHRLSRRTGLATAELDA
jgi:glycosyltransferase involved in cell wall biosynthesis